MMAETIASNSSLVPTVRYPFTRPSGAPVEGAVDVALRACVSCKKDISADANPCPQCGRQHPHRALLPLSPAAPRKTHPVAVILALAFGAWVFWSLVKEREPRRDPLTYTAAEMGVNDGVMVMMDALADAQECESMKRSLRAPVTRGHNTKFSDYVFTRMERVGCYR